MKTAIIVIIAIYFFVALLAFLVFRAGQRMLGEVLDNLPPQEGKKAAHAIEAFRALTVWTCALLALTWPWVFAKGVLQAIMAKGRRS